MINNFSETIEKVKPFIKEITNFQYPSATISYKNTLQGNNS